MFITEGRVYIPAFFLYNEGMKYYTCERINKYNSPYYMIIGGRSDGKTTALLIQAIKNYCRCGERSVYLRRWGDDFKRGRAKMLFESDILRETVKTEGKAAGFVGIAYYQWGWYMQREREVKHKDGTAETVYEKEEKPFCLAYTLNSMEHDKSSTPENITTVIFDEAISRQNYLPGEVSIFYNVISTIVRNDAKAKIYLIGNTVSKFCPYFAEFGCNFAPKMKPGEIRQNEEKSVTIERTEDPGPRESDRYFNFKDKTLSMITGGKWEIAQYPHINIKWTKDEKLFDCFLLCEGQRLHGEVINKKGNTFIFWYPKNDEFKKPDEDMIYSDMPDYRRNWFSSMIKGHDDRSKLVSTLLTQGKVFYATDDTGELLRHFIISNVASTQARYRAM